MRCRRSRSLLQLLLALLAACTACQCLSDVVQGHVAPLATAAVERSHLAAGHRGLLAAKDESGSSSSSSSSTAGISTKAMGAKKKSSGGDKLTASTTKCSPTLLQVARQHAELKQAVQLAAAGYNMFAVDGGKPFTVLVPSDAAVQELAAGVVDDGSLRLQLQEGFYSIVLYSQLPQGALNATQLMLQGDRELQTSLGKAMNRGKEAYTVSFDNKTSPPVATGGWPANNAPIQASYEACDGWLHVMGSVLLPAQQFSNLPRLVDTVPDLPPDAFWQLLDGTNMPSSPPPADPQPPDTDAGSSSSSGDAPKQPHSGTTALVVSGDSSQSASQAPPQLDGSSGSSNSTVLVVAASCAGAAVALCIAVVGVVLWRKRSAAAARRRGRQQVDDEADEDGMSVATSKSAGSGGQQHGGWRPVQLHVDA